MKAAQLTRAHAEFEITEVEKPTPAKGEVLIKVKACGLCPGDVYLKEGKIPGMIYPRIPGHEVIGIIEETGEGVHAWSVGQRVGVGWHQGPCSKCSTCRSGDYIHCEKTKIIGLNCNGGFAEYLVAPLESLVRIPAVLNDEDAAMLLSAGIMVHKSLLRCGANPGERVAFQGMGVIGQLGIQFAREMGFRTFAISKGDSDRVMAEKLGADVYIDTLEEDPSEVLQFYGGAKAILSTAQDADSFRAILGGLGYVGQILMLGQDYNGFSISPFSPLVDRSFIRGWPSGTVQDAEAALQFCAEHGIRATLQIYPLDVVNFAYQHMRAAAGRASIVITLDENKSFLDHQTSMEQMLQFRNGNLTLEEPTVPYGSTI